MARARRVQDNPPEEVTVNLYALSNHALATSIYVGPRKYDEQFVWSRAEAIGMGYRCAIDLGANRIQVKDSTYMPMKIDTYRLG